MNLVEQPLDTASRPEMGIRDHLFPAPWLTALLAILAIFAFVIATPDGVLGTANMIAYAVCHRIPSHSFVINGRQLPLCARCTGTFTGALIGLFGQAVVLRRGKAARFPRPTILVLMVSFIAAMALDGTNSFASMLPYAHYLYEPRNWIRLLTGSFNGLAMSSLIYPIFNATLWSTPASQRAIDTFRDVGILTALELGASGLILTRWPLLLYPVALTSTAGVITLLTAVNTMIFVMIVQRENVVKAWRQALIPALAGLTITLFQISAIDLLHYALTGTLVGIPMPR